MRQRALPPASRNAPLRASAVSSERPRRTIPGAVHLSETALDPSECAFGRECRGVIVAESTTLNRQGFLVQQAGRFKVLNLRQGHGEIHPLLYGIEVFLPSPPTITVEDCLPEFSLAQASSPRECNRAAKSFFTSNVLGCVSPRTRLNSLSDFSSSCRASSRSPRFPLNFASSTVA